MKKTITTVVTVLALTIALASTAFAGISRDNITSLKINVYGMYMTDDSTCLTNLHEVKALSATPTEMDMLNSPVIGSGSIPSTVNCIIVVMKNSVDMSYKSGSYTTTSSGGSDSVCNSGGRFTINPCGSSGTTSVTWPTSISADLITLGLLPASSCSTSATGTEVVPLYLSANSLCTGNSTIDSLIGRGTACSGVNAFKYPSTSSNTSSGLSLTGTTAQNAYAFIVDPDGTVGNVNGSCSSTAPPRFGSRGGSSTTSVQATPSTPTITSITVSNDGGSSPAVSATSGGKVASIVGENFNVSSVVSINGSPCTVSSVNSAGSLINCTTGSASAGTGDVVVTNLNSGKSGTSSSALEYRDAPTITSISPTRAYYYETVDVYHPLIVTISGSGFRTSSSLGAQAGSAYKVTFTASGYDGRNCHNPVINSAGTSITCYPKIGANTTIRSMNVLVTNYPDTDLTGTSATGSVTGTPQTGFNFEP